MTLNSNIRTALTCVVTATLMACSNTPINNSDTKVAGNEPLSMKRIYQDKEFD